MKTFCPPIAQILAALTAENASAQIREIGGGLL
jgi:hypothetical protein